MTLRNILHYPHPHLRLTAEPVAKVDNEIKTLVADMFETMYENMGIGLAATQIDVQKRILVIDISEDRSQGLCFINPVIKESQGSIQYPEGCLSVPTIFYNVKRAKTVQVDYLDQNGKEQTITAEGLLSVVLQHEIDHLDGKLFIDYLSKFKQKRILNKMEKLRRQTL